MKPKNKLGGKLDKLKKQVSWESSKKVTEIAREQEAETNEELIAIKEELKKVKHDLNTAEIRYKVLSQQSDAIKTAKQSDVLKFAEDRRTYEARIAQLKEGLRYYKEGKHFEKGTFGDKVLDKGEYATKVLEYDK